VFSTNTKVKTSAITNTKLLLLLATLILVGSLTLVITSTIAIPPPSRAFILNGRKVSDREALNNGLVRLITPNPKALCSGTLLTNNWILTAAHCNPDTENPANNIIILGTGELVPGHEFYQGTADFAVTHPSLDIALLHLKEPLPVQGSTANFQRGLYPGAVANLIAKKSRLSTYGYGLSDLKNSYGNLYEGASVASGALTPNNYLFGITFQNGEAIRPGDSGGPTFTSGPIAPVLVGLTKTSQLVNPELIKDWALSYLYNRPIQLPKLWVLDPARYQNQFYYAPFWDSPLKNNFSNHATWDPCPNGSFTWTAHYSLEPNADFIYLESNGQTTTLTGWNATSSGSGSGPLTVGVRTDGANQSPGIISLPIKCSSPVLPDPLNSSKLPDFPTPLPPHYTNTSSWNGCPDDSENAASAGGNYHFKLGYDFHPGDSGKLEFVGEDGARQTINLIGAGAAQADVLSGFLSVSVLTGADRAASPTGTYANPSPGITDLTYQCHLKIQCHGPECFTLPDSLPAHPSTFTRHWTPCAGAAFTWTANYDFTPNHGHTEIYPLNHPESVTSLNGQGAVGPIPGNGTLVIKTVTDGQDTTSGLNSLQAICNDW